MLDTRPTTLMGGHILKSLVALTHIADIMGGLDIACLMCSLGLTWAGVKWNNVIKCETSRVRIAEGKINVPLTEITPCTITFKDNWIVYGVSLCFFLAKRTTTTLFGSLHTSAWLLAVLAAISIAAFPLFIRDSLVPCIILCQHLFSYFRPLFTALRGKTIIAIILISIRGTSISSKSTQRLFSITCPTPFMSRSSNSISSVTFTTPILCTRVALINTIFTCCSIASCAKWVNVKGINGFFSTALLAYQRGKYLTFRGILNVLNALQLAMLIGTDLTPCTGFTASTRPSFIEIVKRLSHMTIRTNFSSKQRELVNTMIQCIHSRIDLLNRFIGLVSEGAANALADEHLFHIIPQTRLKSQSNGRKAVL